MSRSVTAAVPAQRARHRALTPTQERAAARLDLYLAGRGPAPALPEHELERLRADWEVYGTRIERHEPEACGSFPPCSPSRLCPWVYRAIKDWWDVRNRYIDLLDPRG